MTVSAQSPVITYTANGSATAFSYPFLIIQASDLKVFVNGTQVFTGFSVSGVGIESGGTVTFTLAPANGATVKFLRLIDINRTTDYVEGGPLRSAVLDADFDRVVMMLQDIRADAISTVEFQSVVADVHANATAAAAAETASSASAAAALASQNAAAVLVTPPFKLIDGTVSAPSLTFNSETTTGLYRPASGLFAITVGGGEVIRAHSSGRIMIGTATDDGVSRLQVTGATALTGALSVSGAATFTSSVAAASFNATSTKRVKKSIRKLGQSYLSRFSQLRPREYDRRDYVAHEFGFIAEEMALVYPEIVGIDANGKAGGIDYGKLVTILTAKLQEQQQALTKLQTQMTTVLGQIKG